MRIRKTTTLWIISYILVLVLPIVISFVTYISVERMMLSQVTRNNRYIVEGKMQSIDSLISDINEVSSSCVNDDELSEFTGYRLPLSPLQRYDVFKFTNKWQTISRASRIDSVYAYFPESGLIISTMGVNTCELFYLSHFGTKEGFREWYDYITDSSNVGFKTLSQGNQKNLFYVCRTIGGFDISDNNPILIAEVEIRKLLEALTDDDGSFFVFDDNNNLVVSTGTAEALEAIANIDWSNCAEYFNIRAGDENLVVSSVKSAQSQWRYVYAVNRSRYMRSIIGARTINYIGIGLSVLLGIILIKISVKRNHKPLEQLVERLRKGSGRVHDEPDDYRYLDRLINNVITQRDEIQDIVSLQQKALRDSVLSKLLKGYDREKDIQILLDSFSISLPYEKFVAGVIYVEDFSEIFFEKGGDEEENLKKAQFIISNVLEELLNQYFIAYVFKCDDLLCFIMNCDSFHAIVEEQLAGCIRETHAFAKNNFNFSFISAVSDCVCGMENISVAYTQALEVLEYKFVLDDEVLLTPHEVEKNSTGSYYYPIQKEQSILNAVKSGDYEAALKVLDEVIDRNFRDNHMSGQLARCFIFDILCTIIKSVDEISSETDAIYLENLNLYSRITECTSVAAMREELIAVVKEICNTISKNGKKRHSLIERVMAYVQDNFNDKSLSVASIAEQCGTTPNYLSLIFKQNTGKGLLDYISGYRVEKAKELFMAERNMSIEEVAEAVGYSNVRTFIRVFSKYENVTPAKYRQNII
ncbi:MAG: AraC family transcriptional regulator [Ruminococcaceae bacterium]|nr:AraC family transcriptional regulator [Oscillospiraceae bacterium]